MSSFNTDEFLVWLDGQDGPISKDVMKRMWPDFPWEYCVGVTGVFVDENGETITDLEKYDGEVYKGYYKRDLIRAARRQMPVD